VSAYIYVEGGASGAYEDGSSSKYLTIRCQQAFHTLLTRMGFSGRKPRLVACGGRGKVYDRFAANCKLKRAGHASCVRNESRPSRPPLAENVLTTRVGAWLRPPMSPQ
jgi:hypothetical protein